MPVPSSAFIQKKNTYEAPAPVRQRANSQTIYKYVLSPDADTPISFPVTFD